MGKLQDFVRECIVNCKTSAEINTQSKAEVLLEKFAGHLDENGTGGGVSSWNDLTDKPFGTVEKEGYIIPESTFAVSEMLGMSLSPSAAPWVANRTYTVKYNGTDYNCVSMEMEDGGVTAYLLGNLSALGGDDTGEPFLIMGFNEHPDGTYLMFYDFTGAESATFSVYGLGEFIETIPEKYLPKTVRVFEVVFTFEVDGNGEAQYNCNVTCAQIAHACKEGYDIRACIEVGGHRELGLIPMNVSSNPTHIQSFVNIEFDSSFLNGNIYSIDSNNVVSYEKKLVEYY